jgi:hypothetical protein
MTSDCGGRRAEGSVWVDGGLWADGARTVAVGGNPSFPICLACDAHALKGVIHCSAGSANGIDFFGVVTACARSELTILGERHPSQ